MFGKLRVLWNAVLMEHRACGTPYFVEHRVESGIPGFVEHVFMEHVRLWNLHACVEQLPCGRWRIKEPVLCSAFKGTPRAASELTAFCVVSKGRTAHV